MSFWEDTDELTYCDPYGIAWGDIETETLGVNQLLLQAWVGEDHPMGGRTYRAVYGPEVDRRVTFELVHDKAVPEFAPAGGCKAIELHVEWGRHTGGDDYGHAEAARLSRMIIDAAVADPELTPYWPIRDVEKELCLSVERCERHFLKGHAAQERPAKQVLSCATAVAWHAMDAAATMLKGLPRGTYPLLDTGFDQIDEADKFDRFTVTVDMAEYIHALWIDFVKSQERNKEE